MRPCVAPIIAASAFSAASAFCGCRSNFEALDAGAADAKPIDAAAIDAAPVESRRWSTGGLLAIGRRLGNKAVFDSMRNRLVVYGGEQTLDDGTTVDRADMWSYDGSGWQLLCDPCEPGSRHQYAFSYDRDRDRIVLFGGRTARDAPPTDDLFEWDGTDWAEIAPDAASPSARASAAFVYDPERELSVLFGGVGAGGTLDDLHTWNGTTWTPEVTANEWPSPRNSQEGVLGVFDQARGGMVVYGGVALGEPNDDAWLWDGSSWTSICSDCTEGAGTLGPLVYDGGLRQTLAISGREGSSRISGTRVLQSTGFAALDADAPIALTGGAVGFDANRDRVVVFGGSGPDCDAGGATSVCNNVFEYVAE